MADNDHMTLASEVPTVELPGSTDLPLVGFGTWQLTSSHVGPSISAALTDGYRHIDTAVMYGNEAEIGQALAASDLDRGELFVTTKIRPSDIGHEADILRKSLRALQTDYLDLWLIHWPPRGAGQRRQMWDAVRSLRDEGLVRSIGVSNYDLAMLDDLIESTGERPAVNQIQWSPLLYDPDVLVGHKARGVILEGYSGLKDASLHDPVVAGVAEAHGVTPAQVILRWH